MLTDWVQKSTARGKNCDTRAAHQGITRDNLPGTIAASAAPALLLSIVITASLHSHPADASEDNEAASVTPWGQVIGTVPGQSTGVYPLLAKAEQYASESLILKSNPDFFGTMSPELIRGIAQRIDEFDASAADKVQKQVISLLEDEVTRAESNKATRLQANLTELNSALDVAREKYIQNKQPTLEPDAESALTTDSGRTGISFYEAAKIIKKKGVNPYQKEARRYYCELGFTGLDTMGVHYVSFC
jgi:hypothetical protein